MFEEIQAINARVLQERENLIRAKIKECLRRIKAGEGQVEECRLQPDGEILIFKEMLEKSGLENGLDFRYEESEFDWNNYVDEIAIRIPEGIISFEEMNTVPNFISEQELQKMEEYRASYDEEYAESAYLKLKLIDLEKLGIDIEQPILQVEQTNGDTSSLNPKDEMYRKVILEKLKYIESSSVEDIPQYSFFTIAEVSNLLKSLRGNEEYIVSSEEEIDATDFWEREYLEGTDGYQPRYEIVHYDTIRLGDKIISFDDSDGMTVNVNDYEAYKKQYGNEGLPSKSMTISQIEEFMQGKKEISLQQGDRRKIFEEALLREDVVEYFSSKTSKELESEFGPEVARMVGFEQKNMHHCYDLWGHTLHTVESVDTTGLTEEQAKKLKVAAFFHDIGKPDVVGFNPRTQQQNFYNHAVHSVDIATPILTRLGYSKDEIAQIGFFIGHHDDFINYKPSVEPKDKAHAFFREITPSTVGEIVVQNKYDFDKLGYPSYLPTHTGDKETDDRNNATNNANKLKVRHICSTLNNNGIEPAFKDFKGRPITISVDMDDVQSKAFSGEFDATYVPTLEDYQLLLELCKADARAQSKEVVSKTKDRTGKEIETVVDTRERKVKTMEQIGQVMPQAYRDVENRDKFLASIFRSATQKAIARDRNAQAQDLAQGYEQQMPGQTQPSLDD